MTRRVAQPLYQPETGMQFGAKSVGPSHFASPSATNPQLIFDSLSIDLSSPSTSASSFEALGTNGLMLGATAQFPRGSSSATARLTMNAAGPKEPYVPRSFQPTASRFVPPPPPPPVTMFPNSVLPTCLTVTTPRITPTSSLQSTTGTNSFLPDVISPGGVHTTTPVNLSTISTSWQVGKSHPQPPSTFRGVPPPPPPPPPAEVPNFGSAIPIPPAPPAPPAPSHGPLAQSVPFGGTSELTFNRVTSEKPGQRLVGSFLSQEPNFSRTTSLASSGPTASNLTGCSPRSLLQSLPGTNTIAGVTPTAPSNIHPATSFSFPDPLSRSTEHLARVAESPFHSPTTAVDQPGARSLGKPDNNPSRHCLPRLDIASIHLNKTHDSAGPPDYTSGRKSGRNLVESLSKLSIDKVGTLDGPAFRTQGTHFSPEVPSLALSSRSTATSMSTYRSYKMTSTRSHLIPSASTDLKTDKLDSARSNVDLPTSRTGRRTTVLSTPLTARETSITSKLPPMPVYTTFLPPPSDSHINFGALPSSVTGPSKVYVPAGSDVSGGDVALLLHAVQTLYSDMLYPTQGMLHQRITELIRKQHSESGSSTGTNDIDSNLPPFAETDPPLVRHLCDVIRMNEELLNLEEHPTRDEKVMVRLRHEPELPPGVGCHFVNAMSAEDVYSVEEWNGFFSYFYERMRAKNFQILPGSNGKVDQLPYQHRGGRYGLGQAIERDQIPHLALRRVGHLCHMVQLARDRGVLVYEANVMELRSASLLCSAIFAGRLPSTKATRRNLTLWTRLEHLLGKLVDPFPKGALLANLKKDLREQMGFGFAIQEFGYRSLSALLTSDPLVGKYSLWQDGRGGVYCVNSRYVCSLSTHLRPFVERRKDGCWPSEKCFWNQNLLSRCDTTSFFHSLYFPNLPPSVDDTVVDMVGGSYINRVVGSPSISQLASSLPAEGAAGEFFGVDGVGDCASSVDNAEVLSSTQLIGGRGHSGGSRGDGHRMVNYLYTPEASAASCLPVEAPDLRSLTEGESGQVAEKHFSTMDFHKYLLRTAEGGINELEECWALCEEEDFKSVCAELGDLSATVGGGRPLPHQPPRMTVASQEVSREFPPAAAVPPNQILGDRALPPGFAHSTWTPTKLYDSSSRGTMDDVARDQTGSSSTLFNSSVVDNLVMSDVCELGLAADVSPFVATHFGDPQLIPVTPLAARQPDLLLTAATPSSISELFSLPLPECHTDPTPVGSRQPPSPSAFPLVVSSAEELQLCALLFDQQSEPLTQQQDLDISANLVCTGPSPGLLDTALTDDRHVVELLSNLSHMSPPKMVETSLTDIEDCEFSTYTTCTGTHHGNTDHDAVVAAAIIGDLLSADPYLSLTSNWSTPLNGTSPASESVVCIPAAQSSSSCSVIDSVGMLSAPYFSASVTRGTLFPQLAVNLGNSRVTEIYNECDEVENSVVNGPTCQSVTATTRVTMPTTTAFLGGPSNDQDSLTDQCATPTISSPAPDLPHQTQRVTQPKSDHTVMAPSPVESNPKTSAYAEDKTPNGLAVVPHPKTPKSILADTLTPHMTYSSPSDPTTGFKVKSVWSRCLPALSYCCAFAVGWFVLSSMHG